MLFFVCVLRLRKYHDPHAISVDGGNASIPYLPNRREKSIEEAEEDDDDGEEEEAMSHVERHH